MSSNGASSGGHISMMEALSRIESRTLKERSGGLSDLRHILQYNRENPEIGNFDDKSFHKIFEVLFVVASDERSNYLKSLNATKKTKASALTRFTNCSQTLRLAVECGVRNIRLRTLKALLDHLTETLLDAHGVCCEPISLDYARCLSAILAFEPHVEHLMEAQWQRVTQFCLDRIAAATLQPANDRSLPATNRSSLSISIELSARSIDPSSHTTASVERLPKQAVVEFIACVRYLTSPPAAPVAEKGESILTVILQYLDGLHSASQAQVNALTAVNNVLLQLRKEKIQVTMAFTRPCLQTVRNLWTSRLVAIKNELLIMLVLLHPYLRNKYIAGQDPSFNSDLEAMVETVKSEYTKRDTKDQLRLEDLRLLYTTRDSCEGLSCLVFSLRDGLALTTSAVDGEHNWTLLRLLALFSTLGSHSNDRNSEDQEPQREVTRKRIRLTHWSDDMLRMAQEQHVPTKVCALQLICFGLQAVAVNVDVLDRILERVSTICLDDNSLVASWALLTISSCATQLNAVATELSNYWTSIWHLAARLVNATGTCRAACHLLEALLLRGLVRRSITRDSCDTMVASIEVNGPSVISEAVTSFLGRIITCMQQENIHSSKDGAERILTWLFRTWAPSNFLDRVVTSNYNHVEPHDILDLVDACLGRIDTPQARHILPVWGPVAQAWILHEQSQGLLDYLLLVKDSSASSATWLQHNVSPDTNNTLMHTSNESLVLGLGVTEIKRTIEQLDYAKEHRGSNFSRDTIRIVASLAVIAECLANCHPVRDVRRAEQLSSSNDKLLEILFRDLASPSCDQANVDSLLNTFASCMTLSLSQTESLSVTEHQCMPNIAARVSLLLEKRAQYTQTDISAHNPGSDDGMDIDNYFSTQASPQDRHVSVEFPRKLVQSTYHPTARKMGIATYAMLVQGANISRDPKDAEESRLGRLTRFLNELSDSDLMATRPILATLHKYTGHFSPENTGEILNHILDGPLRSYEYERSETTHALLLDMMLHEITNWTNPSNHELYQDGTDLYIWLTETALSAKMLSSSNQKGLCRLLLDLLQIDPDYGQTEDLPSIRTTLFGMLQNSKPDIGHYLAENVYSIFELYTLSKHDEIFDDLNSSLPTEIEWIEGISIRLLALAHLAASWPSLLRRCIYGIFETAGQVLTSTDYATHCIAYTSKSLGLRSSQDLFELFAPQLLFTWLDLSRALEKIPFQIFGYGTMLELLQKNKNELYAQLVLRNDSEGIKWLTSSLRMTEEKVMRMAFSKAVAYAMSWDIVFDKERQNPCESHLRKLMRSKNEYQSMVRANFPYIIAQIYISLDQDGLVEKTLEKRPNYAYASDTIKAMKTYSSSEQVIPSTQQPHFKSKYLVDQMERSLRRSASQQELGSIAQEFTASNLTVVLRSILETMHPALGPLHTCQVVRKLRLLIAFAGDNAVEGYPLELLIRALRPLAVESHCADDAIGILHYLFDRGMLYLKTKVSTLTSTTLQLLLSMKSFMVSRQDRTTQESQFRITVSKMNTFHDWIVNYLLSCQDVFNGKDDSARNMTFTSLVEACRDLSLPASADKRNTASTMLKALLDDEKSAVPVLGKLERKQMVALLCRRFESPSATSEDILGSDENATDYANCVWSTTRSLTQTDEYEAWAARVIGRAFAASVTPQIIRPTGRLLPDFIDFPDDDLYSTRAIAAKLISLLSSDNQAYVATAERVLRNMIAGFVRTKDHDGAVEFERLLPTQITEAMAEVYSDEQSGHGLGRSSLLANTRKDELVRFSRLRREEPFETWFRNLATGICKWISDDPIVSSLDELIVMVEDCAQQLFPFLLHLALQAERDKEQIIRSILSESFTCHFQQAESDVKTRLMLETVLYLLTQPIPQERTRMDRLQWLDIDYFLAGQAASRCNMSTAALYLVELATASSEEQKISEPLRRSQTGPTPTTIPSQELLLDIYKNVDDPDSFYGVRQAPSLQSVTDRVDHEQDGLKGMMLHSARMDASFLQMGQSHESSNRGIIRSIGAMNLSSLTYGLLDHNPGKLQDTVIADTMLESARKLQKWDIAPPQDSPSSSAMLYNVCKSMAKASKVELFKGDLWKAMRKAHRDLQDPRLDALSIRSTLSSLAILAEIDELTAVRDVADLNNLWTLMQARQQGWDIGRFDDAQHIVSYRETAFGILSRNPFLREELHISIRDVRAIEVKAVVKQSEFARKSDLIQQSLVAATYLSELVPTCTEVGLKVDAVAQFEAASILWKQGEISSSVQMLKQLQERDDLDEQTVQVGRAGLFAQLGHELAVARLEKPEEIISQYLKPAIVHLGKTSQGSEAGRVYHEFALFCDQQLQNPGNFEDFQRLERLRNRRKAELQQLDELIAATQSSQKHEKKSLSVAKSKAKQWFNLDDQEYQKARKSREEFLRQSLENYLRALMACDDFNSSVVRFFALWLEHAESPSANEAVQHVLQQVPSWKFVGLTNQLTSRLLNDGSNFQKALSKLVTRMCLEHPYHMVHTIYAGAMSTVGHGDTTGKLRKDAATNIKDILRAHKVAGDLISRIWHSCHCYVKLAQTQLKPPARGQKHTLQTVKIAGEVDRMIRKLSVPPATLHLELRPNADYSNVPLVTRFRSEIKIAGGLSAPKILTAMATDGKEYKQLFKGGNDDLRQDAIMEQVFAEVSKMLQNHKATRQRSIHIRTYKVLPLTSNTGIIEFVPNSLPLAEFLNPAHLRYHPNDIKTDQARAKISEASGQPKDTRYKVYKEVTARYHPVLRHFFFERFEDPDEWFERRLAYTRSTAAISILGYVLGLGDRHTQNILLDEKSGEVIHIDLGVAFEAGRVLPIPEVVPFRLTRDIVDGMGVTKTEGVFRRCCEFTLEALREETDSIMTLLNVLRYDPLYNWTLSPLRAKRIQEAQEETEDGLEVSGSKKGGDEAGEADRALSVVEKKLSKTLSVSATVNELIQQATDERNLAVLFAGWAAYA